MSLKQACMQRPRHKGDLINCGLRREQLVKGVESSALGLAGDCARRAAARALVVSFS
jgi:hypothetical protein